MPKNNNWTIEIKPPFQGFSPAYWSETYPYFGNRNMAGAMTDIDIISPDRMTQGPGLAALTSGTQAGNTKTLMEHILNIPSSNNVTWGTGGKYVYKISATAVSSAIEIVGVGAETGKSVVYYNSYVYCFYNDAGAAGEIAKVTASNNAIDPDWGSTTPGTGAAALLDAPHPAILGGDGIIYYGNGRYVGYYDQANDVLSVDELDFTADTEVVDLVWEKDAVWVATNNPNLATGNTNVGRIYVWDTVSPSYQEPIIEVNGKIGALFVKNGRIFVFYQDLSSTGGFKLGYIVGDTIQELAGFTGTLPQFGQVTYFKNMIAFLSDAQIHLWGATSNKVPIALSQYMDGGYATAGALANPFGTLMVASNQSTSYQLAKASGYSILSAWKTIMYDISTSVIDKITVHYFATATGARCDLTLRYDRGAKTLALARAGQTGSITHGNDGGNLKKSFSPGQELEDFRLELDWSNGSATNALAIRKIVVEGSKITQDD